jgi:hypothetical protein
MAVVEDSTVMPPLAGRSISTVTTDRTISRDGVQFAEKE